MRVEATQDTTSVGDGSVGVYACDDGTVQLVLVQSGVKLTAHLTVDEFNRLAVAGIRMGALAEAADLKLAEAADLKPTIVVPAYALPAEAQPSSL